jgi:hypothetical protein
MQRNEGEKRKMSLNRKFTSPLSVINFLSVFFCVLAVSTVLSGCGGGTSGTTGSDSFRSISGNVVDLEGTPVSNAEMTMSTNSGAFESSTNNSGEYELLLPYNETEIDFSISDNNKIYSGQIQSQSPQNPSFIKALIIANTVNSNTAIYASELSVDLSNCTGAFIKGNSINLSSVDLENCNLLFSKYTNQSSLESSDIILNAKDCANTADIEIKSSGSLSFDYNSINSCQNISINVFGNSTTNTIKVSIIK